MVFEEYKKTLTRVIQMYYPISSEELSPIIDYSIQKRYQQNENIRLVDTYKNQEQNSTLLAMADWIMSKEPIVTSYGTMFKNKGSIPNPLNAVVDQFLSERGIYKKKMFKYPKGTQEFEHYNLLQSLSKIDANGIYGTIGQYTSLIYNVNVATSVTSQGRTAVSTMMCFFEMFLANNVLFGSLDEVIMFIDHIVSERKDRKYKDELYLDDYISREECFAKIILTCGYRWVPDEEEMEIIWRIVSNLSQEDLNRVYYKNNLYSFCENTRIANMIRKMMCDLKEPFYSPAEVPEEIKEDLIEFTSVIREYVYYEWMVPHRLERAENMIKDICMISDTDSTIISVNAWYHFVVQLIKGCNLQITKFVPESVFTILDRDEFGDLKDKSQISPFVKVDPEYDYDFEHDELIEMKHVTDPFRVFPEDNVRYSAINIITTVLSSLVNEYMEAQTKRNFSYDPNYKCRILAKSEFLFKRALMTTAKKNYATIQEIQEGNIIPKDEQLDIKGIEALHKSTSPMSTRKALKRILLEDIMNTPTIDQFKILKHFAILEKQIMNSLQSGSREFYKPVTIKSQSNYDTPFRIQGIKASYVWNKIKPDSENLPSINLDERNAVDIAKTDINKVTIERIKDKYPEVYNNIVKLFEDDENLPKGEKIFKGSIDAIAIPLDVKVPEWLLELIDYKLIINNNIAGFPFESIGIQRLGKSSVNYTNIINI